MTGNSGWQPRHDDPLYILAMDHRESFGKSLFNVKDDHPEPAQVAAMKAAKQLIFEGLLAALPSVTAGSAGVLVDEQYGQQVIDGEEDAPGPRLAALRTRRDEVTADYGRWHPCLGLPAQHL